MNQSIRFDKAMEAAVAKLEEMEFTIIDVTPYENVPEEEGQTSVIVCHLPAKACILCVEVFQSFTRLYVTFNLSGQLVGRGYPSARLGIEKHSYFCQTESENGDFTIQFQMDKFGTAGEQIAAGSEFLQQIITKNKPIIAPRFETVPILWLVPPQTKEYYEIVNGPIEITILDHYMKRVLPKLPIDILPAKNPQAGQQKKL